jgi:hypothetical protein
MSNYPEAFTRFTEDAIERQELEAQYIEPLTITDPHHTQVRQTSDQMAYLARSMPPRHRDIVVRYHKGETKAEITRAIKTAPQTITKAITSAKGLRLMSLLTQLTELRTGPALEARRAMLWRIAQRAELKQPTVTLKALDMLNKQAGDYQSDMEQAQGPLFTISINTFPPTADAPLKHTADIIEGEFSPVTVEVKD